MVDVPSTQASLERNHGSRVDDEIGKVVDDSVGSSILSSDYA